MSLKYKEIFTDLIDQGLYLCIEKYYDNCTTNCFDNFQNDYNEIRIDKYLRPHVHDGKKISVCIKFNKYINVVVYTELIQNMEVMQYFKSKEWHIEFTWFSCIDYEYTGYGPLRLILLEIQIYDSIPMHKPLWRKPRPKRRRKNTAYQSWGTF